MRKQERVYCDVRGFVVDTSSHGNPGNTAPVTSGYTYQITESGKFGTGPFSIDIASLKPGTKYSTEPAHITQQVGVTEMKWSSLLKRREFGIKSLPI